MTLYRRGRIWYADFYFQGRRVQEATGTANRREAEKYYALRLSEVECGVLKPRKVPLSEFGEQYLDFAKINKRSWLRDEHILVHLNAFFGATLLTDIGPLNVEQYKQAHTNEVGPATLNREVALLKHMFNLAERWGAFRGINPVRMVKFFDEDNDVPSVLSLGEEERLLSHCSPYLQDLIVFAINTGLRGGDILNLTWEETASNSKSHWTMSLNSRARVVRHEEVPLRIL